MELIELKEFLIKENEEIKKLAIKHRASFWDAMISGEDEAYKEFEKSEINYKEHFNDEERFEIVKKFLDEVEDSVDKRQLKLLYLAYLGGQGNKELIKKITEKSMKIEKTFNTFRAKIGDKEFTDNDIKEILKNEKDSDKLKEAWEASKKQGEVVEKDLIELVKLRNELAKSLGFENYYIMSLELSEQKEEEIEDIFLEIEEKIEKPFKELKSEMDEFLLKRYKIERDELKPWHYQNLFFQEGPQIYDVDLDEFYSQDVIEIAKKFYEDIGLDVNEILKKSDLYEKPKKYQHACCIDMDGEDDVRIIQNVKNNEKWATTTLHELGHAVYCEGYFKNPLPFILKDSSHIFVTEAIALLFERNSKNPSFLKKYCGAKEEEISRIEIELKKSLKEDELIFCKWSQVMFNFERELYKNPEQDLNKLWWNLVEKYQLINFSRDKPDWASKIHLSSSPVYYHNYLLGKLLASQLDNYIVKNILREENSKNQDYSDKRIGEYLEKEIFFPGAKYRWDELIRMATEESLNPKYFIEEFCD